MRQNVLMGLERAGPWALGMLLQSIIILPVLPGIRTEKNLVLL